MNYNRILDEMYIVSYSLDCSIIMFKTSKNTPELGPKADYNLQANICRRNYLKRIEKLADKIVNHLYFSGIHHK